MYGVVIRVPAPIEMYDAVHAELSRRLGLSVDGLMFHVARPTDDGFEVVEVWESKEQSDRYNDEHVGPVVAELAGADAPPSDPSEPEEFEVRGLVIPQAGVYR